MGRHKKVSSTEKEGGRIDLQVKRCPECFINLSMDTRRCPSCGTRVGGPDKNGIARKATNWVSYVVCILSWTILILYIKWAFLS